VESLRAPGSRIDIEHPEGYVSETLFKGSGSSQAAAVVSGSVALLLDARPELTPDQVKKLLTSTASDAKGNTMFVGRGLVNIAAAAAKQTPTDDRSAQTTNRSNGLGSLEAARGSEHVYLDGVRLEGEITAQGVAWDGASWTGASWTGASWTGASWTGASWTGASWLGASWTGASWTGASWLGASWTGASWTGASWTGASWTGASWTGASWTGASWTGASWAGASWTGASWTGAGWM
jgi:serine protease AprX